MTDPAFVGAGSRPGLELWRIEALKPVKIPKVDGKFYEGDSYILLATTANRSGGLSWVIHFWLGGSSSQDEQGVAAYKSVELDASLGGSAVQHREVQFSESPLFLSYFTSRTGLQYLPGGVQSGFAHVVRDSYEPRLLHLKGKRTVRVREVPIAVSSLNQGDVFILDAGLKIFVFNGPGANKFEKAKGVEVAQAIDDDERSGRAEIVHVNDDINNPEFWGPLGGFVDPNSLPLGEDDAAVAATEKVAPRLFRISDDSGSVQFTPVELEGGKLKKELLGSGDVYLVHGSKVFLWIGKHASLSEKRESTARAVQYIAQNGLPHNTSVERVSEGVETNGFKAEFDQWERPVPFGLAPKASAAVTDPTIDVAALLNRKAADDTPVDDGSGRLQIWVVADFKLSPVNPARYGQFYGGDSYVLQYTYVKDRREEDIIYFWLGAKSSQDEVGAAALLAKQKDDELGGRAVQVRVVQGKEPSHFRTLFKGRLIIHAGGKASGFHNSGDTDSYDTDGVALFHVKGTNALNTHAEQVAEVAASLNSEDTFVLITPSHAFAWQGRESNAEEAAVALTVATLLAEDYNGSGGRVVERLNEGSEPEAFWAALGGRGEYPALAPGEPVPRDPRLFHCSNAFGPFTVEEVVSFTQTDLLDEDVFLVDVFTAVFLWVGSQSNQAEKDKAQEFATKFVAEANDGRSPDIPIIRISSGQEPVIFTQHFNSWDPELAQRNKFVDPYQARLDKLAQEKAARAEAPSGPTVALKKTASLAAATPAPAPAPAPTPAPAPAPAAAAAAVGELSYELLKNQTPAGVDPANREAYLSAAEFQVLFGTDKASFAALPKWKRDAKKKELGLF